MKKALLKLVAVCVLATFVVPAFAAGGSDGSGSSGLTTINLWYGAAVTEAGAPPKDWKAQKIIKDKLGINLVLTALPSSETDQDVKINAAAAANSLPDLFMVRREAWTKLVETGVLAPVDDLYPLMPNRTKIQYDADSRAHTTVNGKSYGLASPGSIARNEGFIIRKDWLDKLGLKVPTTLDELMIVMKAFTEKDPDGNGKNDTYGYGAFLEMTANEKGLGRRFDPIMGAFGVEGTWNLTKGTAGLSVRKPEYFDALSYVKSMIDAGVIDPNWSAYKKDDFRAAWKQGRFGIFREQNAALHALSNYEPFDKNFPKGELVVIDPPKGPTGKSSVGVYTQAYRIYAVSANAAKAGKGPAIAKLLEWMSSDEGYYLLGYGEEGINYVKDANGVPVYEGLKDPSKAGNKSENQPLTQLRNMIFYNGDIELLSRYPSYTAPTSGKTMSSLVTLRDMQKRAWTANIGGEALVKPSADLDRFYAQGILEFLTGTRKLDKAAWTAWVAELDKMGAADWEKAGLAEATAKGFIK